MQNQLPFEAVSMDDSPSPDPRLPKLIYWGRIFQEFGLAPSYGTGSHGNLSIRSKDGCLITATQTFLAMLKEKHFVEIVNCDLKVSPPVVRYRGTSSPSTDSLIHWHMYQWRPEVTCVMHGHDPLALTYAQQLGIPKTSWAADAGSPELVELIRPLAHHAYFLIRDHGFVAVGQTVEEVGELAMSVYTQAAALAHHGRPKRKK